jgi:Tol biopolymer transport system component
LIKKYILGVILLAGLMAACTSAPGSTLSPAPVISTTSPTAVQSATPLPPTPIPPANTVHLMSPDGRWTAIIDPRAGSLDIEDAQGVRQAIYPAGSRVGTAKWSPDSQRLAVVLSTPPQNSQAGDAKGLIEIHLVSLKQGVFQTEASFYRPDSSADPLAAPEQITLGTWSPDNRRLTFWSGLQSGSIQADGLPLWVLDTGSWQAAPLSKAALLNTAYQSWAPDSRGLAFTSGGYRSAQVKKWLSLYSVATGQVSTLVPQERQVTGAVAWSPAGDQIAYAAVEASQTGADWADSMSWENPAIRVRRIYLLDPHSGQSRRLNAANAYQDAPRWGAGGSRLYYIQIDGDQAAIMAADPQTGQAQPLPECRMPLPATAGYYGQVDWQAIYQACPQTGLTFPPAP